ncbi:MAG: hypothetical protein E3J72_16620 [Planctomycetota bacterium]|nr:MAG: hypothetical protein E3J72_16620 [Planctomycetota bacterium]
MFGKKKEDRKKLIEEYKGLFAKQLELFKLEAETTGKTLKEIYKEHHDVTQSRAATNIIITRHTGGSQSDQLDEIENIHSQENHAKEVFHIALDEFLKEIEGE